MELMQSLLQLVMIGERLKLGHMHMQAYQELINLLVNGSSMMVRN